MARRRVWRIPILLLSGVLLWAAAPVASSQEVWVSGAVASDAQVTLQVFSAEPAEQWEGAFRAFVDQYYPNVTLDFFEVGEDEDYFAKLVLMIVSGEAPDVIFMHDSVVHQFIAEGLLVDLTPMIERFPPPGYPNDWVPPQLESFRHAGRQYALPWDWAPGGFLINTTLFDRSGLPHPPGWSDDWTWDEAVEAAQKLTVDLDGNGVADQFGLELDYWWMGGHYWVIREFGGEFVDPDTLEVKLSSAGTVEAVQFLADLRHRYGVVAPQNVEAGFEAGNVAMSQKLNDGVGWLVAYAEPSFDWAVVPSPRGPQGRFQFSGGSALAIPRGAKNPQLGYEAIRYVLTHPDAVQYRLSALPGMFVSRISQSFQALPDKLLQQIPNYFYVFAELGQRDGVHPWYFPGYSRFEEAYWENVVDPVFYKGRIDAKRALDSVQAIVEQLVRELSDY